MAIPLESLSANLGSALGTGISRPINEGLDLLAQKKLMNLQQGLLNTQRSAELQRGIKGLQALGFTPEQASGISALDPKIQQEIIKQKLQAPRNEANLRLLQEVLGGSQSSLSPQESSLGINPGININDAMKVAELGLKRQKIEDQSSKSARDFSKPYSEVAERSKANIRDYELLSKLAAKGNLRAGNITQLLSKVGLEDFNRNFDTELASKLIARLGQNASTAFGTGRLTNFLEQTFQRSLPTLWNTPTGIRVISEINMLADKANIIKDDARKQLVRENRGNIPYDAEDVINERVRPQLEELEQKAMQIAMNPESLSAGVNFKSLSDATKDAAKYKGRKIREKSTGRILQSDGKKWIPME